MIGTRLLSATLATSLILAQAGSVLAQTPSPIERTPEMEAHAAELAALFPESLGGVSLRENLDIAIGQELIGELDPSDPDDAEEIAQLQELAAAAGATLDDAATVSSYAQLDDEEFVSIVGFQVRGGDIGPAIPVLIAAWEEDTTGAVVEQGQVGDVDVTTLSSADDPEGGSFVLVARGDLMWVLMVPGDYLEEAIGSLP